MKSPKHYVTSAKNLTINQIKITEITNLTFSLIYGY